MATKRDLERFATKDDLYDLGKKMDSGFENVRKQMSDVRDNMARMNEIMVSKADLEETIRRQLDASPYAKETDMKDLRERLLRVEEKLRIKPSRRALS